MQILIVDDEDIFRRYLLQVVDWRHYGELHFLEAVNGRQAVSIADNTRLDLMLADIEMPLMNGLDCAGEVKRLQPECEVVLISAHDQFAYAQAALKIGIADFLVKPVDVETLTRCLDAVIGRIRERQSARCVQYQEDGFAEAEHFTREWGFIQYRSADGQTTAPHRVRRELVNALRDGYAEVIDGLLIQYISDMESSGVPQEGMKNQTLGLITLCLEELKRAGVAYETVFPADFSPYTEIGRMDTPEALLEWLREMYRCVLDGIAQKGTTRIQRKAWEARRRIEENYADSDFNIASLAKNMFVNEGYIRKLFKQAGWCNPAAYLKEVRMQAALILIRDEGRNVTEASGMVGFNAPAYFSKCFKAHYGCSPSYYEDLP